MAIFNEVHEAAELGVRHPPHKWEFDNAALRESASIPPLAENLKNIALQLDDNSEWMLMLSARLDKVYIECLDWADCITRYDSVGTLVYCDPPYYQTAGYGVEFTIDQYVKMAEIARDMKGKLLISVNDCGAMREIFSGFVIERLAIKYSCGKIANGQARKESFELLIRNF